MRTTWYDFVYMQQRGLWNYNGFASNNEVVIVSITNIRLMQLKNTHSTSHVTDKVKLLKHP